MVWWSTPVSKAYLPVSRTPSTNPRPKSHHTRVGAEPTSSIEGKRFAEAAVDVDSRVCVGEISERSEFGRTELRKECEAANAVLENLKRAKEMVEQEVKGKEVELAMANAAIQSVEKHRNMINNNAISMPTLKNLGFEKIQNLLYLNAEKLQFVEHLHTRFLLLPKSVDITRVNDEYNIPEWRDVNHHRTIYFVSRSGDCVLVAEPPTYISVLDVLARVISHILGSSVKEFKRKESWRAVLTLAYQSLGVVYGDLSISPLYVFKSTFAEDIHIQRLTKRFMALCPSYFGLLLWSLC